MNECIELIRQTFGVDELGDAVTTESTRTVLCWVRSIGQQEFYQAHATGLKPEIKFVLTDYLDYEGETALIFQNERYRVLRTFRNGVELEIVAYREVNPA